MKSIDLQRGRSTNDVDCFGDLHHESFSLGVPRHNSSEQYQVLGDGWARGRCLMVSIESMMTLRDSASKPPRRLAAEGQAEKQLDGSVSWSQTAAAMLDTHGVDRRTPGEPAETLFSKA